ncbi:uncharacterized protein LOC111087313 [Limulus polyphemus]|uniref:Uncharacterized protein LOC111087313 n=1 Tax=Limulus polyphemus TaxID=6850 RepID=A0ABM1T055_LIMPO|nr:uncharacterized protein LOC111087313 [Limulus polyphemus]
MATFDTTINTLSVSNLMIQPLTTDDEQEIQDFFRLIFAEKRQTFASFQFSEMCRNVKIWIIIIFIITTVYMLTSNIIISVILGITLGITIALESSRLLLRRLHSKLHNDYSPDVINPFAWSRENNHTFLVGKIEGVLIAAALFKRGSNGERRLGRMFVRKDLRSRGIGKLMVKRCIEMAKDEECKKLQVRTSSLNSKSVKFYMNSGFKVCGTGVLLEQFPYKWSYVEMEMYL